MSDIKIFVSHRIDKKSFLIKNPIYVPIRCGAVFDNRHDITIPGDDTGENISSKRENFCELTVQYWAGKNESAQYYGLCHYRRYLSFSDRLYPTNERNMIIVPYISSYAVKHYGLDQPKKMQKVIKKYDAIFLEGADVRKIPTPDGFKTTVWEHWSAHDNNLIKKEDLYVLLELIQTMHPDFFETALKYFKQNKHIGYNCFILKRELFDEMCEFQFDILFELEKRIDLSKYEGNLKRTPGFMGEILFGIFMYYLKEKGCYSIKELQLIYFEETQIYDTVGQTVISIMRVYLKIYFNKVLDFILPKGSKQRKFIKKMITKIFIF